MKKFNVVITDCDHENVAIENNILKNAGLDFKLIQCKTEEDLITNCKDANSFINQYAPITEKVLQQLPLLKFVVRYGVGFNNIDIDAATRHGVQVCNIPDYAMNEVADQALALMLSLTRKVILMNNYIRKGVWNYLKSVPIYRHSTQTVGIIGLGRIGSAFAKRVHSLGCKVIGYDVAYNKNNREYPDYIKFVSLEYLLKNSDIISIHSPLESSKNMFGEEQLKMMKSSAYLINVSRGGIINEKALDKALSEKWIAGAGLDVLENEPLTTESPLYKHENIIFTPHMAWYSEESSKELKRKVAEETIKFAKGEKVYYPINKIE